jgi:hypothetical protein
MADLIRAAPAAKLTATLKPRRKSMTRSSLALVATLLTFAICSASTVAAAQMVQPVFCYYAGTQYSKGAQLPNYQICQADGSWQYEANHNAPNTGGPSAGGPNTVKK